MNWPLAKRSQQSLSQSGARTLQDDSQAPGAKVVLAPRVLHLRSVPTPARARSFASAQACVFVATRLAARAWSSSGGVSAQLPGVGCGAENVSMACERLRAPGVGARLQWRDELTRAGLPRVGGCSMAGLPRVRGTPRVNGCGARHLVSDSAYGGRARCLQRAVAAYISSIVSLTQVSGSIRVPTSHSGACR